MTREEIMQDADSITHQLLPMLKEHVHGVAMEDRPLRWQTYTTGVMAMMAASMGGEMAADVIQYITAREFMEALRKVAREHFGGMR